MNITMLQCATSDAGLSEGEGVTETPFAPINSGGLHPTKSVTLPLHQTRPLQAVIDRVC